MKRLLTPGHYMPGDTADEEFLTRFSSIGSKCENTDCSILYRNRKMYSDATKCKNCFPENENVQSIFLQNAMSRRDPIVVSENS